jgi:DNA repair protein RadC
MENKINQSYQVSEIQLICKSEIKPSDRPQIKSSQDAYKVFIQAWDMGKIELVEQFKVLFLNRANRVMCIYELSTGGITGTVVDPRLIFAAALKMSTCGIILAHNHPSGNKEPSVSDIELTMKVGEGGKLLDIKVLDHLILTSEGYFSLADEGHT